MCLHLQLLRLGDLLFDARHRIIIINILLLRELLLVICCDWFLNKISLFSDYLLLGLGCILDPIFVFDVGVTSFLLKVMFTNILLHLVLVFVLDVLDYKLIATETL